MCVQLQLELVTSRSMLDEAEKRVKDLSHKNTEMEAQLRKKIQEKEHELEHMQKRDESCAARLRELETKQQIAQKETEMQIAQAQQQQTGMAMELNRLQKDRNREDEFSKAFQQEFEANKAWRAKCTELQNQLDSALDQVDVSIHVLGIVCGNLILCYERV